MEVTWNDYEQLLFLFSINHINTQHSICSEIIYTRICVNSLWSAAVVEDSDLSVVYELFHFHPGLIHEYLGSNSVNH